MTNRDTRYYRLDTVNENAKFLLQCYGKEKAYQIVNASIQVEQDNPHALEYWTKVFEKIEENS